MANNYITLGYQGEYAKDIQKKLNLKGGYGLAEDGIIGEKSISALKDFQAKQGLDVDGILGPETWALLMDGYDNPFYTEPTPSSPSNSGATNNATSTSKAPTLEPAPTKPISTYTPYGDTTEGQGKNQIVENALAYLNSLGDFIWKDQEKYNEYLKQWEERPDFSYNFNEDALYQQYKDQYMKQGKMAMMDTMGQAAALTGGYGNSYAQMVGQQAYNAQLENLNDIIPELYGMALDKYQMEGQDLLNTIGLLGNERDYELGLYKDDYARRLEAYTIANDDYYNSANMYKTEQDAINDLAQQDWQNAMAIWEANNTNAWNQAQWEHTLEREKVADEQWQKEYDAVYGNKDGGVITDDTDNTGYTGGNNSTDYAGNQGISDANIKKMQNALGITADGKWGSESTKAAGGLSAKEAWAAYQNGTLVKKNTSTGFTGSTYSDAVAYAKANGVPSAHASGIMTASEWNRRKSSYQTTGQGGAEVKNYSSYKDYLAHITEYLVETYTN